MGELNFIRDLTKWRALLTPWSSVLSTINTGKMLVDWLTEVIRASLDLWPCSALMVTATCII